MPSNSSIRVPRTHRICIGCAHWRKRSMFTEHPYVCDLCDVPQVLESLTSRTRMTFPHLHEVSADVEGARQCGRCERWRTASCFCEQTDVCAACARSSMRAVFLSNLTREGQAAEPRPLKHRRTVVTPGLPANTPGARRCRCCYKWRMEDEFGGEFKHCIECRQAKKAYDTENITYRRHRDVATHHNITVEEYRALLEKQRGKCALCGLRERNERRNGEVFALAVDHDHDTNAVRGLICYRCNQLVAWLERTDWKTLRRAWRYMTGESI